MESNELLASLAKMEASLNEVDSVRKQVESTVNASLELQKKVSAYIDAVNEMCIKVDKTANDFKTNTENAINDFKEQNGLLSKRVEELNQLIEEFKIATKVILNEIQNLRHDICNISDHLLHVISICQEIKDDLHTSTNDIKTLIENTNKETAKNININRWIMIAGFIIVVILLFVFR